MSQTDLHSPNLKYPSKEFQNLSRLITLAAIGLPLAVLIVVAIAASIAFLTSWEARFLLGGGILLLGLLAVGSAVARLLQKIASHTSRGPGEVEPERKDLASLNSVSSAIEQPSAKIVPQVSSFRPVTAPNQLATTDLEAVKTAFNQFQETPFETIVIHEKIKLVSAHATLAPLFGYEPHEITGLTILDLTTQESHSIVLKYILSKYDQPYEVIGLKKDGSRFPIEILNQTLLHWGQTLRVMGVREVIGRELVEIAQSLQQAKEGLEQEVKRSTTELRSANEHLQLELNARRQVEQALRESEERYRKLVEFSPNGIIVHAENRIAYINATGAMILGAAQPEHLLGRSILEFRQVDGQPGLTPRSAPLNGERKEILPEEQKYTRLDGQEIEVEVVEIPFIYQNKAAVQLVIRDISVRKKAEAEITQRNRELTILQAASVAITSRLDLRYVLDTVSEEMARLLSVESCTIFEWQQAEMRVIKVAEYSTKGWWDSKSQPETHQLADYPLLKSVLEEQIPEQMTISQLNGDPGERSRMQEAQLKTRMFLPMVFQKQTLGLVRLDDSRVARVFSYQEISLAKLLANQAASAIENARLFEQAREEIQERQRAEAALEQERALLAERVKERTAELSRANAELAKASKLKDEFLASMSHELRTPLNAILGSAEILQSQVFGPLQEKQAKYVKNVDESGKHLLSLINDILDLSKIEAGRMELTIQPVSVQAVCEASLRLVKQMAHKKRIGLVEQFNNTVTALPADERRLKQILVNLLSNAVKFTPEGGRVGLEVSEELSRQVIHFAVWDTGIGIAQADMSRLFQPFTQLDSALSRQYAGTGLGLSLISRMVEMHGGGIAVESEVGQGSRFTVTLPYASLKERVESSEEATFTAEPAILSSEAALAVSPCVLLAEDNELAISMFTDYLQVQGFQVVIARNGYEALERAGEEKPDIILMDTHMPGMDGLEATRRLKADDHLAAIPIIIMTALAMPMDRERCLAAGANDYLSKPVSLQEMVKTIRTYLG